MKMHLYISDMEEFLAGDYSFCLKLSDLGQLGGDTWTHLQEIDIELNQVRAVEIREMAKKQIAAKIAASKKLYEDDMARYSEQANKIADAERMESQ